MNMSIAKIKCQAFFAGVETLHWHVLVNNRCLPSRLGSGGDPRMVLLCCQVWDPKLRFFSDHSCIFFRRNHHRLRNGKILANVVGAKVAAPQKGAEARSITSAAFPHRKLCESLGIGVEWLWVSQQGHENQTVFRFSTSWNLLLALLISSAFLLLEKTMPPQP